MTKPIVALIYDFDNTLSTRDMQEFTFIPALGMEAGEFWDACGDFAHNHEVDSILTYMYLMAKMAKEKNIPLTRDALMEMGKEVEFFDGVTDWFERINEYGRQAGVKVEHYIVSSGLKEIIDGTVIAKYFKRIFASEFMYNDEGNAIWAKMAVNYTNKTQFVYRINKGVLDINNNVDLNKSQPDDIRRVFFRNMIYIGDGLTDVPCMKLVKQSGGHSIALYHNDEKHKVQPLLAHERVDWIFDADFSEGSELDHAMHTLIRQLGCDNELQDITYNQKREIK
jgi:2-hydroxy-3-keto-5-methylthiopentenyl-1-phosphate phosphatase